MIHKRIQIITLLSLMMLVLVSLGNGCTRNLKSIVETTALPSSGPAVSGPVETVIPGTKTAALVNSNQVLNHLTSCLGVAQASDQTQSMYNSKKTSISSSGKASSVTAPMLMAIASISGEVCNDLLEQEKLPASLRMFAGMDLVNSTLPSNSVMTDVITRISLSCWQRQPTSSEMTLLLDLANTVGATETLAGRKAALLICTAMLGSLDAILN